MYLLLKIRACLDYGRMSLKDRPALTAGWRRLQGRWRGGLPVTDAGKESDPLHRAVPPYRGGGPRAGGPFRGARFAVPAPPALRPPAALPAPPGRCSPRSRHQDGGAAGSGEGAPPRRRMADPLRGSCHRCPRLPAGAAALPLGGFPHRPLPFSFEGGKKA